MPIMDPTNHPWRNRSITDVVADQLKCPVEATFDPEYACAVICRSAQAQSHQLTLPCDVSCVESQLISPPRLGVTPSYTLVDGSCKTGGQGRGSGETGGGGRRLTN